MTHKIMQFLPLIPEKVVGGKKKFQAGQDFSVFLRMSSKPLGLFVEMMQALFHVAGEGIILTMSIFAERKQATLRGPSERIAVFPEYDIYGKEKCYDGKKYEYHQYVSRDLLFKHCCQNGIIKQ